MGQSLLLKVKDEFLICLMRLRLGLFSKDLQDYFKISSALDSKIFVTWFVAVSANSAIIFVSKPYTGHISDKQLVLKYNYLDKMNLTQILMTDKGLPIEDECTVLITFILQFQLENVKRVK